MSVSPPRPKGPPLNALRAFEAAARLGGFALAAEELSVTPGAVSQHIKTLEDWSGAPLFERRSQGVRLTEAGQALMPMFTEAFDHLGVAVRALRDVAPGTTINIAALPSVAQLWLSPRLPELRAATRECPVSITALERPPNMLRGMFDLSMFIDIPTGSVDETVLAQDAIYPVCTPDMASRLKNLDDLNKETLLHDHSWEDDWQLWARHAGCKLAVPRQGAGYSLYALALEDACQGAGVLIGHDCLVRDAVQKKRLVAPFDVKVPTGRALVLRATGKGHALKELIKELA